LVTAAVEPTEMTTDAGAAGGRGSGDAGGVGVGGGGAGKGVRGGVGGDVGDTVVHTSWQMRLESRSSVFVGSMFQ
jgi:hypothetical protein